MDEERARLHLENMQKMTDYFLSRQERVGDKIRRICQGQDVSDSNSEEDLFIGGDSEEEEELEEKKIEEEKEEGRGRHQRKCSLRIDKILCDWRQPK